MESSANSLPPILEEETRLTSPKTVEEDEDEDSDDEEEEGVGVLEDDDCP
eukprot:CAMPEP_0114346890 /NCGR_PEP_ID=MMETSP0101-20121206/13441_1 /TAXON_ID=38822 ORGANISM="Pteridomonas danica, Strain PT" /NCGR_SAMPLE_ID=MMETSP0101 /ASSEMBLY_ACC=CAM_ASM_000211 /LENGTH=49 /DNA_ID=CAMNT_0001483829 /DNA_START=460 /DNA_END=609 /DNA_ORIENTATION=-